MPKLVTVYRSVLLCYVATRSAQGLYWIGRDSASVIKDRIKK